MMHSRVSRLLSTVALGLALAVGLPTPASAQAQASVGAPAPPCFPLVNGTHPIGPRAVLGDVGLHVFWFCSARSDQAAKEYGFSVPLAQAEQWHRLNDAIAEITKASAKVATAQRLYSEAFSYQCVQVASEQTARGRMCRERQRILDARAATWLKE